MKNQLNKYLLTLSIVCLSLTMIKNACAVSKLDFFAPIADISDKIGKVKTKIETKYNTVLEKMNAKVEKVAGREGAMIFKYVQKNSSSIVKSAAKGQFYAADYTGSGMIDALKSELGDMKFDIIKVQKQLDRYVKAREKEKLDKSRAMSAELAKLKAEYSALNKITAQEEKENGKVSEENAQRLLELEAAIAKQEAAIEMVKQQDVKAGSETYEKMKTDMDKMQAEMRKLDRALKTPSRTAELLGKGTAKLDELAQNMFNKKETDELYDNGLNRLFLGEYEQENPQNIARIMKIRKQEYYKAVKNAMETVITTYTSIDEIQERSVACTDASTQMAQGVFGAATMRVCVELQNAKVAARYMEILLAQIRLETTKEMQAWTDKYKMYDYSKDPTSFNLDNYVLKKGNIAKSLKAKAKAAINKKITNFDVSGGF